MPANVMPNVRSAGASDFDPTTLDVAALMRMLNQRDVEAQQKDVELRQRDRTIALLQAQLDSLQHALLQLRRAHFGVKSEQIGGLMGDLFTDTTSLPMPPAAPTAQVPAHQRRLTGRPSLPADLPRVRKEYELSEAERAEFDQVHKIGEDTSETLDYTPPKLVVVVHARAKYRCERAGVSTIRVAHAQCSPLPKSNASAGLLAHVVVSKLEDGIPLHRQSKLFDRHGLALADSTLGDWFIGTAQLLGVLMPLLKAHLLAAPVIFGDDTPHDLLQKGPGSALTARLWAYISAGAIWTPNTAREPEPGPGPEPDDPGGAHRTPFNGHWRPYPAAAYFEFTTSREGRHPMALLGDYSGYLQADDYSGWAALFRGGRIQHAACMAHARRKFFEIAHKERHHPGLAAQALEFYRRIYEVEKTIKDASPDERLAARGARTLPILEEFKAWLDGHLPTLLPKGPLAKAFKYALSNWEALTRFTTNGMLAADSNLVERSIRTVAVARKNHLFFGAETGGTAAATLFSLIESCKLNDIEPYAYLRDVLERIPNHRQDRLHELLPFNWIPVNNAA